jgi:hypothetical protein
VLLFSPHGAPCTASECAEQIDHELVEVERSPDPRGWWAAGPFIFYESASGIERMLLEAVITTYLTKRGRPHTDEDVRFIAARLTRPVAVRSAP